MYSVVWLVWDVHRCTSISSCIVCVLLIWAQCGNSDFHYENILVPKECTNRQTNKQTDKQASKQAKNKQTKHNTTHTHTTPQQSTTAQHSRAQNKQARQSKAKQGKAMRCNAMKAELSWAETYPSKLTPLKILTRKHKNDSWHQCNEAAWVCPLWSTQVLKSCGATVPVCSLLTPWSIGTRTSISRQRAP